MADVVVTNTSAGLTGKKLATVTGGQVAYSQDGAVATGTTTIPADDTIPQNTEGTQFMSVAITPTSATNKLRIDVCWQGACNTANLNIIVALFQDSTANALAVMSRPVIGANFMHAVYLTYYMTAGTTSATTFKVRAGAESASTLTFNGSAGSRYFGGVFASFISVTEIEV